MTDQPGWAEQIAWAEQYDILLIEGCDGAGKTTLANALAHRRSVTVTHSPITPDGINLVDWYQDILSRPAPLVLDRCFISECVYGPLYRSRARLNRDEVTALVHYATARNGVFVHVTAEPSVLHRRLVARDDSLTPSVDQLARIVRGYTEVFSMLEPIARCLQIDTTSIG